MGKNNKKWYHRYKGRGKRGDAAAKAEDTEVQGTPDELTAEISPDTATDADVAEADTATILSDDNGIAVNKDADDMPDVPKVEVVGVAFREAGKIYYFSPAGLTPSVGEKVIVDTSRGTEIGTVKLAGKQVPETDIIQPLKSITRIATKDDLLRDEKNREMELDAAIICKKKIAEHKLGMSLAAVEYTFDNSKLIFYFTCESRVDFRELVKDLASTFRTRIELRQIGIRDETKMMGGLGICGRKYCCAGFLTDFVQVSIKMAKEQNFALNSTKASGACGRLMCCLRYEHEVYEAAIKVTPPTGTVVKTPDGEGVVIEIKPLAEEVRVRLTDKEKDTAKVYKVKDLKIIRARGAKHNADTEDEGDGE
ncbi:MAG: stage 0 sporulation family protein [Clostridia bacterium]|nr:stage 0 sporulation family protein [Clostridia bacterium]